MNDPQRDGLYRRFVRTVEVAGLPAGPNDTSTVTDADLAGMLDVVQRYLRFMGVLDRPRDWSFRARFVGRFRLRPRLGWMPAEAWQYNSGPAVARVFVIRLRFAGVVPMVGSDTYLNGHGRMLGKLLDRIVSSTNAARPTTSAPQTGTPTCPEHWFGPSGEPRCVAGSSSTGKRCPAESRRSGIYPMVRFHTSPASWST